LQSETTIPDWVPPAVRAYLLNTVGGRAIRAIARERGVHASTVSRQIRKVEMWRDDPLIDSALDRMAIVHFPRQLSKEPSNMIRTPALDENEINREARRILRRLCEHDSFLLMSPQAAQAVVFKELVPGKHTKLAGFPREVAEIFALREWISCDAAGTVTKYFITSIGRAALKRMLAGDQKGRKGSTTPFQDQHKIFGERVVRSHDGSQRESLRFNLAESPLSLLARKKDRNGGFYLSPDLLEAGERFRADFESARIGPRVAQNWDRFMTCGSSNGWSSGSEGSAAAHERVSKALSALGPGLGDIALRVCCFLEGLEKAEKRLGWSARSGKVVLKIALQRLAIHYGIVVPEQQKQAS